MMFQTLEGLTAEQQEALEAEQRAARGSRGIWETRVARPRGSLIPATLKHMQPGRAYAAGHLIAATGICYSHIQHMLTKGLITRSGERWQYRFTKVEPGAAVNALEAAATA